MPRQKKPRPGDPADPEGLHRRLLDYLEWMQMRNYSPKTIKRVDASICRFIAWCEERSIHKPREVTRPILERYAKHLYHYRTSRGAPLTFRAQYNLLSVVRMFFKYLVKKNHLPFSPAHELDLPRIGHQLPRTVLTHEEMERVLAQPDLTTELGIRDRAMLETLHSTGIRRMELIGLSLFDLDRGRGTLMIRKGKGQKDRVVPIGERALAWNDRYLSDVRPALVVDAEEQALYVTAFGKPLSEDGLSRRVTRYVEAAQIGKQGSCHLFRHTMATLMLERGADVRAIQEMLGHSSLEMTQVYTQVSIQHLKEVHRETHPAAKLGRTPDDRDPAPR